MRLAYLLTALFALPASIVAQNAIPAGTLISVSLDHGVNASKLHVAETIRARVVQTIPGTPVRRGDYVIGKVVQENEPAKFAVRFDTLEDHSQRFQIQTNLRAIASFEDVQAAQVNEDLPSNPDFANTQQIGGDQVYRGGGAVTEMGTPVGRPEAYGVLATPQTQLGQPCRGTVADNTQPQSMGQFSANACGVYGFPDVRIEDAGRLNDGIIVLSAINGKLNLGSGSALLLRVD